MVPTTLPLLPHPHHQLDSQLPALAEPAEVVSVSFKPVSPRSARRSHPFGGTSTRSAAGNHHNHHHHDDEQMVSSPPTTSPSRSSSPDLADNDAKSRPRPSVDQMAVLWASFNENPMPNASVRRQLASQLDMTPRAVQIWFQNRRQWFRAHGVNDMHSSKGPSTVKRSGLQNVLKSHAPTTTNSTTAAVSSAKPTPTPTPSTSTNISSPSSPSSSPLSSPQATPATLLPLTMRPAHQEDHSHHFAAASLLSFVESLHKLEPTTNTAAATTQPPASSSPPSSGRPCAANHWRPWD